MNAVNPGPVETDRLDMIVDDIARAMEIDRAEARQLVSETTSMGRIGEVDEIADVVAFIASPRASFVNGATVAVDGG